jgi:ATP-dependent protease ClpP protease subunit
MNSWYTIRATADGAELSIHDEIGAYGVSAKDFIAELGKLPGDAAFTLRLNSPGGSVFDAVAIYNALKRHAGPVTVSIDGIAASAASYIAMAGDSVVMPENAFLMIHDPSGLVMGTAADMRAMAEALDKIASALIKGYAAKSGKAEDEVAALMAAETWFTAAEAVEAGFANSMSEPVKIAASFDVTRFRNAPPAVVEALAKNGEVRAAGTAGGDPSPPTSENSEVVRPAVPVPPVESATPLVTDPSAAPDSSTIHTEAMDYARAVVDLCRLAGQPQMAAGFLEREASLEEVRAALLTARAEADPEITAHHPQPGPGPLARPWTDIINRTFKRKG